MKINFKIRFLSESNYPLIRKSVTLIEARIFQATNLHSKTNSNGWAEFTFDSLLADRYEFEQIIIRDGWITEKFDIHITVYDGDTTSITLN